MEYGLGWHFGWTFGLGGLVGLLASGLLIVVPFWQLWRRTGHSGWISLLMMVPLVNLILLWTLAFKGWPIEEDPALRRVGLDGRGRP
ncbi:MAG: hypothetical protein ACXIU8_16555 [Alkalilacustris sp.]